MSQENIIIVVAVAIVALIIGLLIGKSLGKNDAASEANAQAQKELESYKEAVSEHFGKTADLVDNLTQSYKEVFEHLGSSAKDLLSEEQVKQHLAARAEKAVTLTYLADEAADHVVKANPMEQAQAEIQSEKIAEEAEKDAEKMAESMSENTDNHSEEGNAKKDENSDKA